MTGTASIDHLNCTLFAFFSKLFHTLIYFFVCCVTSSKAASQMLPNLLVRLEETIYSRNKLNGMN